MSSPSIDRALLGRQRHSSITLFDYVSLLGCVFVVGGDFNVHVEDVVDPDAIRLTEAMYAFCLVQIAQGPTHQLVGILELVILPHDTADVQTIIHPPGIVSDQSLIVSDALIRPARPVQPPRTVRGWRLVDRAAFVQALADSSLARIPAESETAEELFSDYNRVL